MTPPRFRDFARLAAVASCCVALSLTGCRREVETPMEQVDAVPDEVPASVTEISSEYFVVYPGAVVDTAALEKYPTKLLQTVDATPEEIVDYYRRYYHGKGWTDGPNMNKGGMSSRVFVGDAGWVTLGIQAPEGGTRLVSLIYHDKP